MTAGGGLAQQRATATTPEDAGARLPLSPAQEGFWLLQSLDPAGSAANEQFAIFLDGALDPAALAQAWRGVLARHEVLRARFGADDGQPWQRFDPQPGAAPRLVVLDHLGQLGVLAVEPAVFAEVSGCRLAGQQPIDLCQASLEVLELGLHRSVHEGLIRGA